MASDRRRRILIVDSNEQESGALVQLFQSLGHEASATWSGRDALEHLASERFDLLIVDQCVPDMFVGDFMDQVFKLPNHPRIAIAKRGGDTDKLLDEYQLFDRGRCGDTYQALIVEFPEFCDGPLN